LELNCYVCQCYQDGTPTTKTFEHVPSEIGAEEAEEVGVEHLLRLVAIAFREPCVIIVEMQLILVVVGWLYLTVNIRLTHSFNNLLNSKHMLRSVCQDLLARHTSAVKKFITRILKHVFSAVAISGPHCLL
jgi:hypothetical protein